MNGVPRVLIGCEKSGVMRRAFERRGYDAWSCDLLPADDGSNRHMVGDVRERFRDGWDLLIVLHPPCTRLCNSGVRWLHKPPRLKTLDQMWRELREGAAMFSDCWNAPIERVAVENPVMHGHGRALIRNWREPSQTVQPWFYGDPFFKATCWWLRNLPSLEDTDRLTPPEKGTPEHRAWSKVHRMPPGAKRCEARSETFPGMAEAAADQWGLACLPALRAAV